MTDSILGPVEPDLDWCHDIVQDVSRTFALTVTELDEPLASEICVGYLLCRVADTIEDADHIPPAEQISLLESYRDALDPTAKRDVAAFKQQVTSWIPDSPSADWDVVAGTECVVQTFRSLPSESREEIRPQVTEMIEGMTMFISRYAEDGGLRVKTVTELEEYCWYVAGTVGHLVTALVARDASVETTETLYDNATSFGLLLQLVNVAKDIAVDYEKENNVYVPADLLAKHGLSTEDIGTVENGERFAPVVMEIVSRAEEHATGARRWLDSMPVARGNTLSAWAIPYLLAIGTMRELRSRPADVIEEGDVKVSRMEVGAIVSAFADDATPSVAKLQEKIESGAFSQ